MSGPRCTGGKGWEACETCINREHDPFQCEDCDEADMWEGDDETEWLTFHELKAYMMKEAA